MKNLIEFKLENGESAFMQIEESEEQTQARQRVSRSNRSNEEGEPVQAPRRFDEAIQCIAPIGNALLTSLKDINTPDEISLELVLVVRLELFFLRLKVMLVLK